MKHILLFCVLTFAACADYQKEPLLLDEIKGEWVRVDNPNRHYIFADGYATTWIHQFGTNITAQWFEMSIAERDASLKEINTGQIQVWRFSEMQGDTLCTVADASSTPTFYFNLKRN